MIVATICTIMRNEFNDEDLSKFMIAISLGGLIGSVMAVKVKMINMP